MSRPSPGKRPKILWASPEFEFLCSGTRKIIQYFQKSKLVLKMTYDGHTGVSSVGQTGQKKQRQTILAKLDFWMFFSVDNTWSDAPSRGKSKKQQAIEMSPLKPYEPQSSRRSCPSTQERSGK